MYVRAVLESVVAAAPRGRRFRVSETFWNCYQAENMAINSDATQPWFWCENPFSHRSVAGILSGERGNGFPQYLRARWESRTSGVGRLHAPRESLL